MTNVFEEQPRLPGLLRGMLAFQHYTGEFGLKQQIGRHEHSNFVAAQYHSHQGTLGTGRTGAGEILINSDIKNVSFEKKLDGMAR